MKNKIILKSLGIVGLSLTTILVSLSNINKEHEIVNAASGAPTYVSSLTKNINLNKNTDTEIRNYYSSLNSLSQNERQGQNLLKNLRPILQDMNYFSYDNAWKIYEITDREWELSPASETTYGTYNASTNSISNYEYGTSSNPKNDPYVKTLYRNKDDNGITVTEARIKEWGSHTSSGTNREHIWCQSRGFKDPDGASGPAGTDLHHLRSGDGYVNQTLHNDNPYGYVDTSKTYTDGKTKQTWLEGNLRGKPKNASPEDEGDVVFEPQDSDKGDIARAIFYMAACYNNLDGKATITDYNPNLQIVDVIYNATTAITSSATKPATMAKLSDLLEWHKLDPVDEFEIYRNDLIYNNYQNNRNPFIDFPSWVDVIWGSDTSLVADPTINDIHGSCLTISHSQINVNLENGNTFTLSAKTTLNTQISWSISDESIITADKTVTSSNEVVNFTALKEGEATITASVDNNGKKVSISCSVTISSSQAVVPPVDDDTNTPEEFKLELWMIIVAAVIIVVLIIILATSSKARKKAKKAVKKAIKSKNKKK